MATNKPPAFGRFIELFFFSKFIDTIKSTTKSKNIFVEHKAPVIQPVQNNDLIENTEPLSYNDIIPYTNKLFVDLKNIESDALKFGILVEDYLENFISVFNFITKNTNYLFQTSNTKVKLKGLWEFWNKRLHTDEEIAYMKQYYLVDYIGYREEIIVKVKSDLTDDIIDKIEFKGKTLFELKSFTETYAKCKKKGYINFTRNKINGLEGDYFPYYRIYNILNQFFISLIKSRFLRDCLNYL
jgi:hypothetical protein